MNVYVYCSFASFVGVPSNFASVPYPKLNEISLPSTTNTTLWVFVGLAPTNWPTLLLPEIVLTLEQLLIITLAFELTVPKRPPT